ncbi:hypothetical protein [Symbiobacterium terraclitae]|uniref:hypothetical protein n=1 Tax=Symbiobacterium terraclitae TaxID=557451 RepID=UPI0035B527EB
MDDFCIVDRDIHEVVSILQGMGYNYVRTPVAWKRTSDYLAVIGDARGFRVAALPTTNGRAGVWPWENGGCQTSDPPLIELSKVAPKEGLGNFRHLATKISAYGEPTHFPACYIYGVDSTGAKKGLVLTVLEPADRVADGVVPGVWNDGKEFAFSDHVRDLANQWVEGDYLIVWCPESDSPVEELVRRT